MAYYQRVLEFLFFILFCACCNLLISKYLKGKISVAVERIEMRNKEYPSVTVCPVNSLKENQDKYLEDDNNMTSSEILTKFKDAAWKRNETFYYVSYVTENSPGFECLTDKSSNDPVKPCSFPYVWENQSKCQFLKKRIFTIHFKYFTIVHHLTQIRNPGVQQEQTLMIQLTMKQPLDGVFAMRGAVVNYSSQTINTIKFMMTSSGLMKCMI